MPIERGGRPRPCAQLVSSADGWPAFWRLDERSSANIGQFSAVSCSDRSCSARRSPRRPGIVDGVTRSAGSGSHPRGAVVVFWVGCERRAAALSAAERGRAGGHGCAGLPRVSASTRGPFNAVSPPTLPNPISRRSISSAVLGSARIAAGSLLRFPRFSACSARDWCGVRPRLPARGERKQSANAKRHSGSVAARC